MQRAAYTAWGRENHCCADLSFAMVGPASSGKTTLARLFAKTVMLPFIEVAPQDRPWLQGGVRPDFGRVGADSQPG